MDLNKAGVHAEAIHGNRVESRLNSYIGRFANGSQIVMMAFGLTGSIFVGLSAAFFGWRRYRRSLSAPAA